MTSLFPLSGSPRLRDHAVSLRTAVPVIRFGARVAYSPLPGASKRRNMDLTRLLLIVLLTRLVPTRPLEFPDRVYAFATNRA